MEPMLMDFSPIRDMGPPYTASDEKPISLEIDLKPFFKKTDSNLSFEYFRDFPLDVKHGMLIVKLKWKI